MVDKSQLLLDIKRFAFVDAPEDDWFSEMFIDTETMEPCLLATNRYKKHEWHKDKDYFRFIGYSVVLYDEDISRFAWVENKKDLIW